MRTRNRTREETGRAAGADDNGSAAGAGERRQQAERLVAEADAILERALEGDSQRFLEANLQRGGQ